MHQEIVDAGSNNSDVEHRKSHHRRDVAPPGDAFYKFDGREDYHAHHSCEYEVGVEFERGVIALEFFDQYCVDCV